MTGFEHMYSIVFNDFFEFIENQIGMYFSIAWGLNPRLLSK